MIECLKFNCGIYDLYSIGLVDVEEKTIRTPIDHRAISINLEYIS